MTGSNRDEGRETLGQFVLAGGDTARLLGPAEEALYEVVTAVEMR